MKNKPTSSNFSDFIGDYLKELKSCLDKLDRIKVIEAISLLTHALEKGKTVFVMGNGGGASTATHIACDLGKGTLRRNYDIKEPRLKVISLAENTALLTAFGNDLSFEDIFAAQLKNLIEKDDVLIILSGSGNSPNLVKALIYGKKYGAKSIGILGFHNGGKLGRMVDVAIIAQSKSYGPCEDFQLVVDHILTACIAKYKQEKWGRGKNKNMAVPYR